MNYTIIGYAQSEHRWGDYFESRFEIKEFDNEADVVAFLAPWWMDEIHIFINGVRVCEVALDRDTVLSHSNYHAFYCDFLTPWVEEDDQHIFEKEVHSILTRAKDLSLPKQSPYLHPSLRS